MKGERKMEKILFTVKEASKYLNCSESSMRKLIKEKQIPYFRIQSKILFNKETIDNWIENQQFENTQKIKERR
jgi:excisionase family DNA binding protein